MSPFNVAKQPLKDHITNRCLLENDRVEPVIFVYYGRINIVYFCSTERTRIRIVRNRVNIRTKLAQRRMIAVEAEGGIAG